MVDSKSEFKGQHTAKSAHPCSSPERAGVVQAQSSLADARQLLVLNWLTPGLSLVSDQPCVGV